MGPVSGGLAQSQGTGRGKCLTLRTSAGNAQMVGTGANIRCWSRLSTHGSGIFPLILALARCEFSFTRPLSCFAPVWRVGYLRMA